MVLLDTGDIPLLTGAMGDMEEHHLRMEDMVDMVDMVVVVDMEDMEDMEE